MRLTNDMLEAIIFAASLVEAEGMDAVQSCEDGTQDKMFEDIMKVADWPINKSPNERRRKNENEDSY